MTKLTLLVTLSIVVGLSSAQFTKYKICATSNFDQQCQILQRGASEVSCIMVQDSVECAQLIRNNTAQFGVFNTESALHVAYLGWEELVVLKELRHNVRLNEPVDFSSVVIVKKPLFKGGLENLRGSTFCHPGYEYSRNQRWTERFLKEFERNVQSVSNNCERDLSIEELEVKTFLKFFNSACRPGKWSNNPEEDTRLKSQYPNLCLLCDDTSRCTYSSNIAGTEHRKALECLKTKGEVTYVSLQEAQQFFKDNADSTSQYQFFCPNGTVQPALTDNPCTWLDQPWPVILANREKSVPLNGDIGRWLGKSSQWEEALVEILTHDSRVVRDTAIQAPRSYINPRRPIPVENDVCNTKVTWCTASLADYDKCIVARAAGITSGVYPLVECRPANSDTVRCLNDIAQGNSDFMGIDSNYGYIARNNFNLTAAMYAETDELLYSRVIILVKPGLNINKFEDLRGRKACFPEFGGIASVAFVDAGRSRGIFSKNECNYGKLLASYFGDTCAPGAKDVLHDTSYRQSSPEAEKLCKLCDSQAYSPRSEPNFSARRRRQAPMPTIPAGYCTPTTTNRYFGTRGALQCFDEMGEVAVVEIQKLKDYAKAYNLDVSKYEIMCRDGSVIPANNFDGIPENCPLVTVVDGEVVIRRGSGKQKGVVNVLNSFDRYFNLGESPSFKIFNKFAGTLNVLFEDSTIGLISTNSTTFGPSVQNYIRLFANADSCVQKNGVIMNTVNIFMVIVALSVAIFRF